MNIGEEHCERVKRFLTVLSCLLLQGDLRCDSSHRFTDCAADAVTLPCSVLRQLKQGFRCACEVRHNAPVWAAYLRSGAEVDEPPK
jgi:hypothetical protein